MESRIAISEAEAVQITSSRSLGELVEAKFGKMKLYSPEYMSRERGYRARPEQFDEVLKSPDAELLNHLPPDQREQVIGDLRSRFERAASEHPALHWFPSLDFASRVVRKHSGSDRTNAIEVMALSIPGLSAGFFQFREHAVIGVSFFFLRAIQDGNRLLKTILSRRGILGMLRVASAHRQLLKLKRSTNEGLSMPVPSAGGSEAAMVASALMNYQVLFIALHEVGHYLRSTPADSHDQAGVDLFVSASGFSTSRQLDEERHADDYALERMLWLATNKPPDYDAEAVELMGDHKVTSAISLAYLYMLVGALSPRSMLRESGHPHPVDRYKAAARVFEVEPEYVDLVCRHIEIHIRSSEWPVGHGG